MRSINYTSEFVPLLGKEAKLSYSSTRESLVMDNTQGRGKPLGTCQGAQDKPLKKFTDANLEAKHDEAGGGCK